MSLAKLHAIKAVRKPGTCGKCGVVITKGDPAVRFTVGYRGFEQVRCGSPACFPRPSERESSMVAEVYAAQEEAVFEGCESLEDIRQVLDEVRDAVENVISQYEENGMYESNYELQDRVSILEGARDELESWEPEAEEPTEDNWKEEYSDCVSFENAHSQWLDDAIDSAQQVVNEMDIP